VNPPLLPQFVSLKSRDEVRRWCDEFGCSEADLWYAVWKAGPEPEAVRAFLNVRLHGGF
jgi:hypothetical protein